GSARSPANTLTLPSELARPFAGLGSPVTYSAVPTQSLIFWGVLESNVAMTSTLLGGGARIEEPLPVWKPYWGLVPARAPVCAPGYAVMARTTLLPSIQV